MQGTGAAGMSRVASIMGTCTHVDRVSLIEKNPNLWRVLLRFGLADIMDEKSKMS